MSIQRPTNGKRKDYLKSTGDRVDPTFSSWIVATDQRMCLLGAHSLGPISVEDLKYYRDRKYFLTILIPRCNFLRRKRQ
jgi:hypothetical protein